MLNEAFSLVFREACGERVLEYLRSITINSVSGPENLSTERLLHNEGARWLYAIIDQRVKMGREGLPKLTEEPDERPARPAPGQRTRRDAS